MYKPLKLNKSYGLECSGWRGMKRRSSSVVWQQDRAEEKREQIWHLWIFGVSRRMSHSGAFIQISSIYPVIVLPHLSLLLSSLDHPVFWPGNPSHPFKFHLHRKKNSPASGPPGGSSAAWWRSTRSLRAPSGPPAVSAGTSRIGESQPPAARPPPCPGTAGSSGAPGWWRRPTENHHKNRMKAAVWLEEKKHIYASNGYIDLCRGWTGDWGRGRWRFTMTSPVCCSLRTKLSVSVSGPASRRRNSGCSPSASLHT